MGLLDRFKKTASKVKDTAEDLADDHGDQIKAGIDKAADAVEKKTSDAHDAKVEKAADAAKGAVDKLAGDDRDDKKD